MKAPHEELLRARRAFDGVRQIAILKDWRYDGSLQRWYLEFEVNLETESSLIPVRSEWFITAEDAYPKGVVKVYPSVRNSLAVTLQHQSNNSKVEANNLWRQGDLCLNLAVPVHERTDAEPDNADERLLWHIYRTIMWIESAINDSLVKPGDRFELPDFSAHKEEIFAFAEDSVSYMQWEDIGENVGTVQLSVRRFGVPVSVPLEYKSASGNSVLSVSWGKMLRQPSSLNVGLWFKLSQLPLITYWQPPSTYGELLAIFQKEGIDFFNILEKLSSNIRDGQRHIMLVGFPIPKYIGHESELIYWQAIRLPQLAFGKRTAKGFRTNALGYSMHDRVDALGSSKPIHWIKSQNWSWADISERGKLCDKMLGKRVLVIGCGSFGSLFSESLVRSGVRRMTLMDLDIISIGNMVRHTLLVSDVGGGKAVKLCDRLNSANPHADIDFIEGLYPDDLDQSLLTKYDLILDCTGDRHVLSDLRNMNSKKTTVFASFSMGVYANHIYVWLWRGGPAVGVVQFADAITPFIEEEKHTYSEDFPRDGIGCWHPAFPARIDDVQMACSVALKELERFIGSDKYNELILVLEKKQDEDYTGYCIVRKIVV